MSCSTCCYAGCHFAECRYAECHYAESHFVVCHHAKRRYAKCRVLLVMLSVVAPFKVPHKQPAQVGFMCLMLFFFFAIFDFSPIINDYVMIKE